jgi:hypothetical protein
MAASSAPAGSSLDQLSKMTIVVADTGEDLPACAGRCCREDSLAGEIELIKKFKPTE